MHAVRPMLLAAAFGLLPACGDEGDTIVVSSGEPAYDWYVDAALGNDGYPGTEDAPFKTITRAMAVALAGQTVKVRPGTYDAALGETFPLAVKAHVRLYGDEANKGAAAEPTVLQGAGTFNTQGTALMPGESSLVAGFRIFNDSGTSQPMAIALTSNGVTLRNNTVPGRAGGGDFIGIFVQNTTVNHRVIGNVLAGGGGGTGWYSEGSTTALVEGNSFRGFATGAVVFTNGVDFGGGGQGSLGLNTIAGNATADFHTVNPQAFSARNNFWDHVPPSGNDLGGSGTVDTTGAMPASP